MIYKNDLSLFAIFDSTGHSLRYLDAKIWHFCVDNDIDDSHDDVHGIIIIILVVCCV